MAPSTRHGVRRGAPRVALVTPAKFFAEYPTYDEEYFAEDIILTDQPILEKPSLEMLHHHRYITLRVGSSLAVHSINSEKLFNKSTYGKELLSRMCKIPNARSFRVDYPEEEEEVFINFIEWINYGKPTLYKDTFRGSFLRHLKLYLLALKYGVEGLAQYTFEIITDMLVVSHPEQTTRAPFWSAVVNLVYSRTEPGDDMRCVVTGYTLWYLLNGRAKDFKTKHNTVKVALLALAKLQSASPFYRIDCSILHENPDFYKEKLDGFFGSTRSISPERTQWWKDAIEDSLFGVWTAIWKMIEDQKAALSPQDGGIYVGDAAMVKGVDEEDEIFLESYGEKVFGAKYCVSGFVSKNGGSKGGNKKSGGRNRAKVAKAKGPWIIAHDLNEIRATASSSYASNPLSALMSHYLLEGPGVDYPTELLNPSAKQVEWILKSSEVLEETFNHATKRISELENEKEKLLRGVRHTTSPSYIMALEFVLVEIEAEARELDKTVKAHPTMIMALEQMKRTPTEEGGEWRWGEQGESNGLKCKLESGDEDWGKKRVV